MISQIKKEKIIKDLNQFLKENDIEMLDKYVSCNNKNNFKCLKKSCGYEWSTHTTNIVHKKTRCPKCSNHVKRTNEEIDQILKEQNKSFIRIEDYVNNYTKISWQCLKENCRHIWKAIPSSIIHQKSGCPRCVGKLPLSNDIVDRRLEEHERNIKRIGEYINNHTKIEWRCLVEGCGYIWKTSSSLILDNKRGCPRCNSSKGELEVEKILIKILLNTGKYFKTQVRFKECRDKLPLPFDFVIYNKDGTIYCIIEFDGKQHFELANIKGKINSIEKQKINYEHIKLHDSIKNKYCLDNNIKLIRIPYYEFKNIEEILTKELG